MTVARKTLDAIELAMRRDGGAKFRELQRTTLPKCEDAYKSDDGFRHHLGASKIGAVCNRELWYSFHWAYRGEVEPRMLRLWNRGHLEEGRMVAMLLMIGVQVYQHDANGKQFRISDVDGHFGGSTDGVLVGVPDLPTVPVLGEFKTHNTKSFAALIADGLQDSKREHWIQMQLYMRKLVLSWGLYMAVNKDTDALHAELVAADAATADGYINRARYIVELDRPPQKLHESASWYQCRYCDMKPVCHLGAAPLRNCRTCKFARLAPEGQWACARWNATIPKDVQPTGCNSYEINPALK